MTEVAPFVSRPLEPVRVEAIQYDGSNDAAVNAFVAQGDGRLIEWIDPDRWVTFDGNAEGFPVPLNSWVTRTADGEFDMYEADEFAAKFQPDVCGRCRQPFKVTDTAPTGRMRFHNTQFCRSCVDRCHESTDFAHECVICASPKGGERR